ncbi:MAG TPA: error-prone DNA polymerase [Acidocella sp.]|jgi:error-prone DNA polymerase|uniref:error-prone DNA polymerase n=1 Tax=Acidocella sp. TaxID=50710 RepID=UPI002BCAED9F|nr:error-prone DNA polymerase [Acidocella sp.]HVE20912.1 error-prone DNA polymerase [Acidocella sp.]
MNYAELQVTTHFSFLRGASAPEELFEEAARLGISALGIVDHGSLAGIVQAHVAAKAHGVRLVVGARVDVAEGAVLLLYPTDRAAYARLCRLLSVGKARGGKGQCVLGWADMATHAEGMLAVLVPDEADDACRHNLEQIAAFFPGRAYLALTLRRRPGDALRLHRISTSAVEAGVPTIVTNDVLFHASERRILQDVVTCIREGCTIDEAGFRRERHADRYLKPPMEMRRLFARYPEALARTQEILERCRFSLDELCYQYPEESPNPQQRLEELTWEGAAARFPDGVPADVTAMLRHELGLIGRMGYAAYFLTVHSIVRYARSQGILCQGRGSAANSAVCYVLGITAIDPVRSNLLFERFISEERREPPDIDVDFEHERRETVLQWVFDHYGRDRAALCAVVTRYRARGALRDAGKALGLTEDVVAALNSQVSHWSRTAVDEAQAAELGFNAGDRRLRLALELARQLIGTPRHLSQHPGGFVLTRDRLDELVPIEPAAMENRQVIEWDKDDINALGFMKVDCLALGMLSCLKRSLDMLAESKGLRLGLADIPTEDQATYEMIRHADTIGVFQIESRAQMSMLPRLKPKTFYDLVIEVAIVRPGPIQGDMVHPYLRRREGKEKVEYPSPALEKVLKKTLGVPLFQEQAMQVAMVAGGFSANEADALRRAMATFKNTGTIGNFRDKLVGGMIANGYAQEFAERTFAQLEGFGSYGFPESHAASFALLAYASSWLKCHHPEIFCAALLNSQPMGFYAPAQIVRDARDHGVEVRPVCLNASRWDCTLEKAGERFAVRLGLRMVKGLANAHAAALLAARGETPFSSPENAWRRAGMPVEALLHLAEADAFGPSLGLQRRQALWALRGLNDVPLPLFAQAQTNEPGMPLPPLSAGGEVLADYASAGLSLRAHPVSFLRGKLCREGIASCGDVHRAKDGAFLEVAGLILVRQRPGSAEGVLFVTLEDETGIANLVVWPDVFEAHRRTIITSRLLAARGRVQREGEVVHLVVRTLRDLSVALDAVGEMDAPELRVHSRDFR